MELLSHRFGCIGTSSMFGSTTHWRSFPDILIGDPNSRMPLKLANVWPTTTRDMQGTYMPHKVFKAVGIGSAWKSNICNLLSTLIEGSFGPFALGDLSDQLNSHLESSQYRQQRRENYCQVFVAKMGGSGNAPIHAWQVVAATTILHPHVCQMTIVNVPGNLVIVKIKNALHISQFLLMPTICLPL